MTTAPNGSRRAVRLGALALTWAWAVGWVVLGALFGTGGLGGPEAMTGAIVQALIPGAIFIALAIVATRWAMWGGVALFLCGVLVGVAYTQMAVEGALGAILFIELTMALPPIIAGALLILTKPTVEPSPDAPPPAGDLP